MRTIRIIKTGVNAETGRTWLRGVIDLTTVEQAGMYQLAMASNARPAQAGFGLINGIPDAKAALLSVGDVLETDDDNVSVRFSTSTFVPKGTEEAVTGLDAHISLGCGDVSRTKAPEATCNW